MELQKRRSLFCTPDIPGARARSTHIYAPLFRRRVDGTPFHIIGGFHATLPLVCNLGAFGDFKLDGSVFTGREPDRIATILTVQDSILLRRISLNPTPAWRYKRVTRLKGLKNGTGWMSMSNASVIYHYAMQRRIGRDVGLGRMPTILEIVKRFFIESGPNCLIGIGYRRGSMGSKDELFDSKCRRPSPRVRSIP